MIPITQDRVGEDGNCLSACLASILEVPLQTVSDFAAETSTDEEFLRAVNGWLAKKGVTYRQLSGELAPVGWHVIEGVSPRGGQHAVVGRDGRIVWDPHPQDGTGRGLAEVTCYGVLEPVAKAKDIDFYVLLEQDRLYHIMHEAGQRLKNVKGVGSGYAGMTPDNVKATPTYQEAQTAFKRAERTVQQFNQRYASELKIARKLRARDQRPGETIRLPNGRKTTIEKVTPARNLFGEEELHVKTTTGEVLPVPVGRK